MMTHSTTSFALTLLTLFFLSFMPSSGFASTPSKEVFTFAVVPQQAASKLARSWNPILKYITSRTGIKLSFRTAKNIPAFEKELAAGTYDLAYMNPYHYITFSKTSGYRAFSKAKNKLIHGIIVVHKDNISRDLQDLAGGKLAFPSPLAFAASILPRAELNRRHIPFQPFYVSSHDSVYRNVASKLFIAGGGIMRTFNAISPDIRNQLRILYTTPGYTPHAFAYHPRVPTAVIKMLSKAMVDMDTNNKGRSLLNILKIQGIEAATHSQWNDIQALKLNH